MINNVPIKHTGLPAEHPGLGLEEGRPGGLPQRDQVRDVGPVLPGPRVLHPGQQHDHRQQHHHQSRDAQVRFAMEIIAIL